MGMLGGNMARAHGPWATGMDRDLGPFRQFQNGACIALGQPQRQIAGNRDKSEQFELWRSQGQQDRRRVVGAGISVDDDWARHRVAAIELLLIGER
jgi:hypothetical protein